MKHTKGKWTAVKGEYGLDIDANEGTIATIYANDGEAKANANLIASAPEMLEMLRILRSYIGDRGTYSGYMPFKHWDDLQSLIVKAEGN